MSVDPTILADVPLFKLLDARELAALAERVDMISKPAGTRLFNYGDAGDSLFIVCDGQVEIFFKNDTGERVVLETACKGNFFGEISLLDGCPRTASADVTKDMVAVSVGRADLEDFLRARPTAAMQLLTASGRRLRYSARLLRRTASRNINLEMEDKRTAMMRAADWIAEFSGSMTFLFIHCAIFLFWIVLNTGWLARSLIGGWDRFPFGLLTMVVSLEAIVLSVFVLLSQNRQAVRERVRNDIEYEVNLKAELEIEQLHEKFDQVHGQVLERLATLEKAAKGRTWPTDVDPEGIARPARSSVAT